MASRKNSVSMVAKKNQSAETVTKFKEFENNIKNLLEKPFSVMVDAAFVTAINGAISAAATFILETVGIHMCSVLPIPQNLKLVPGKRFFNARNIGVLIGVDNGLRCALKEIRGKDDVQARMVAGLGAGVLFGVLCREDPKIAISFGVLLALAKGGLFEVVERSKSSK